MMDISIDGVSAFSKGFIVQKFVSIPAPEEEIETYSIPGRDGNLIRKTGKYKDITVSVDFVYKQHPNRIREQFGIAKNWFLSGGKKLKMSDDQYWFYRIKHVEMAENKMQFVGVAGFKVTFTLYPYRFRHDCENLVQSEDLYNQYNTSFPVYYLTGNGMCVLSVNNNKMAVNVAGKAVIDTEREIAYNDNGRLINAQVSGDYRSLCLTNGDNKVSVTQGFTVQVAPMWRCL